MLICRWRTHALRFRLVYLMRRFLFVTLFASLLIPTVAKAETIWLVIQAKEGALEKIEMSDMESCQTQGEAWKRNTRTPSVHYWTCFEGK